MASGGARARSGPPPDPEALRRDRDKSEWVALPEEGRAGPPPQWPLSDVMAGELEMWAREWERPQAVMWERNGQELEVGLLVRAITVAEGPKATAADRNVVQRKMTDLGITVPGMRANRWTIGPLAASQAKAGAPTKKPSRAKSRLKVVQGGRKDQA